jgi:hypothetical protein
MNLIESAWHKLVNYGNTVQFYVNKRSFEMFKLINFVKHIERYSHCLCIVQKKLQKSSRYLRKRLTVIYALKI